MNRIDRLTAILIQLQSKRVVKAQEIADRFGISLRTVYRDVRALEEGGVPLAGEAGVGYSIVEGYRLPPVMFTNDEASALLFGAKLIEKMTDQSVKKEFQSALYKIKSVLKLNEKDHLEQLNTHIEVFHRQSASKEQFPDNFLTAIQQAIVQKNVLWINYLSTYKEEVTQRDVEPMGLLYYGHNWHMIAFCQMRQGYRDFRVDRIKQLRNTQRKFKPKPGHSLETYIQSIAQTQQLQEMVVCFDKAVLRFVGEQKYAYGFVSEESHEASVQMRFLTAYPEGLGRWLLMFGKSVSIQSPDNLKETMKKLALELHQHYL
ncbi:MAG: YafY family protein [Bacteroidota bacterium]